MMIRNLFPFSRRIIKNRFLLSRTTIANLLKEIVSHPMSEQRRVCKWPMRVSFPIRILKPIWIILLCSFFSLVTNELDVIILWSVNYINDLFRLGLCLLHEILQAATIVQRTCSWAQQDTHRNRWHHFCIDKIDFSQ